MTPQQHSLDPHRRPPPVSAPMAPHEPLLQPARFRPPRRRWPGVLAAGAVGAVVAGAFVSSYYDARTLGQRLDAGIHATEQGVRQQVEGIRQGAAEVVKQGEAATQVVAGSLSDAGITAAVKAALAADPALSALRIDVDTRDGVVTLTGPAPDEKSRERAAVIAAAPEGVKRVDNRLHLGAAAGG